LFTILISFYEGHVCPPVSGSESTFSIWIRIKPTKTNADPASDPQYWRIIKENSNTEMPTLGQRATVQGASPHSQR
jgi:hypothetical protein